MNLKRLEEALLDMVMLHVESEEQLVDLEIQIQSVFISRKEEDVKNEFNNLLKVYYDLRKSIEMCFYFGFF